MGPPQRCPRCGADLAPDAPGGLCPACLLKAGLGPCAGAGDGATAMTPLPGSFGLCAAVLRCLEKQPARRFRDYGELRAALLPYASAAPTPATLGWRFVAYMLDMVIWCALTAPLGYVLTTRIGSPTDLATYQSPFYVASVLASFALAILCFALTEGLRGASIGKAICGLRVVGPGRSAPGVARALVRAAIFILAPVLPLWIWLGFDPAKAATLGTQTGSMAVAYSQFVVIALVFLISARRRNGFAGLHDLASGTRVIRKAAYEARPPLDVQEPPLPVSETTPQIGPYYLLDRLEQTEAGELLVGYDARLRRRVWIRRLPEGAPPAPAIVRGLGRATRLRWLGGTRAAGENWDAYEAPAGRSSRSLSGRSRGGPSATGSWTWPRNSRQDGRTAPPLPHSRWTGCGSRPAAGPSRSMSRRRGPAARPLPRRGRTGQCRTSRPRGRC